MPWWCGQALLQGVQWSGIAVLPGEGTPLCLEEPVGMHGHMGLTQPLGSWLF